MSDETFSHEFSIWFHADQERTIETLKNCSLPTFSAYVEENLTGVHPRPEIVWTRMISEAAHYYAARLKLETLRTAEQYRQIGMAMCKKYPAIALVGGTTPWVSPFSLVYFALLPCIFKFRPM